MCVPRELLLWSLAGGRIRFWSLQDESTSTMAHLNLFRAVGYVALSYLPTYLSNAALANCKIGTLSAIGQS